MTSLHHLKLMMDSRQRAPLSSLALEIPLRSPNLRSLHLVEEDVWLASDRDLFIDAFDELLKNFQLEEFVCNWLQLSQDMLKVVLSMPNLSTMDILRAAMPDLAQILHTHPVQEARIRKFRLCAPRTPVHAIWLATHYRVLPLPVQARGAKHRSA